MNLRADMSPIEVSERKETKYFANRVIKEIGPVEFNPNEHIGFVIPEA